MEDERWRFFPCEYCGEDIDTEHGTNFHGIGSPHMPAYAHYFCDADKLREAVTKWKSRASWAERVCWAAFHLRMVDSGADQQRYEQSLVDWYRGMFPDDPTGPPDIEAFWKEVRDRADELRRRTTGM